MVVNCVWWLSHAQHLLGHRVHCTASHMPPLREVQERNVHAVLSYEEDPQPFALANWLLLLDQQKCFLQVWNWKLLTAAQELKIILLPNAYIVFHLANGCFPLCHGSKVELKLKSLFLLILLGFPFIQLPKHKYWVCVFGGGGAGSREIIKHDNVT